MNDQCFGIADIGQMAQKIGAIDKLLASCKSAFNPECEYGACATWHIGLRKIIVFIIYQAGVIDPFNL